MFISQYVQPVLKDDHIIAFQQIKQQHPGVKLKYLAEYCFSGTYILTLLTEGYNFTSENYRDITFIEKVSRSQSNPFLSRTPCVCVDGCGF